VKKKLKNLNIVKNFRNYLRTKKLLSSSRGQITLKTPSGKLLYNFLEDSNIQSVLEIGTWNGLGSTLTIYEALNKKGGYFSITSLETDKIAYKNAKKNLKNKKEIKLILGRILEINELPNPEYIDFKKHNLNPKNIDWLYQDIRRYKKTNNIYNLLDYKYDLILFDGGEFSTYAEFKKLYEKCTYFCLDDIHTYKQFEVLNFIDKYPDKFELLKNIGDFSIYKVAN